MKKRLWRGFTLVELLVVLFILGMLILLVVPNIAKQKEQAQVVGDEAIIKVVETQMEMYRLEFPEDVEVTADELVSKKYIDKKQQAQYEAAIQRRNEAKPK